MLRLQCLIVCFSVYLTIGDTTSLPFIKPCKPDDNACIKESGIAALPFFADGDESLGLLASDPIVLNDVRADDKDLKLGFRNLKVTGAKKCKILELSRDLEKSTIKLVVDCPLSATGQYSLSGKILFLVAEGDGDFLISTETTKIEAVIKIKVVEKEGKEHWKITGFDYKYDILDNPVIELTNLFGGDETRAKPIMDAIKSASKDIIRDIGGGIIKELIKREVDIVQKAFNLAPVSELVIL